jgi:hypothetical protein
MSFSQNMASRMIRMICGYHERRDLVITIIVIQMFLLFLSTGSVAIAKERLFKARYAGAVTTTEIDINADEEETARISQGIGTGTIIGRFLFHEIRESDDLFPEDPENTCDEGEIERVEVHWTIVMTDQIGANQLYFRLAEDQPTTICIDPNSPPSGGGIRNHEFDIIGGTNRFENAGGHVTVECSGYPLAPGVDASGPAHGAVSCTMSGSIDF